MPVLRGNYGLCLLAVGVFCPSWAQEPGPEAGGVVFRSDVTLVRVDAQVLDSHGRAVTGLRREDFVLRESGREREIRNFANENMPADVLILVDVSTSMRAHVERVAAASREALGVLGPEDRVAMMVFDRQVRLRMPFRLASSNEALMEFGRLLNQENFSGGTNISKALYEAANYMKRSARREARRAVVILTDDQTEFDRDEYGIVRAMTAADTVVSLLLAPDAMGFFGGGGGGNYPSGGGGTWPGGGGSGGGIGGVLGDILLGGGGAGRFPPGGGRYPRGGGGRFPGGGGGTSRTGTQSAGTAEVASRTGGDTIQIDDASAFATTLSRIRQRYALYFTVPDGARSGEERNIAVDLAAAARRRYPSADVRYRRTYVVPDGVVSDGSVTVSQERSAPSSPAEPRAAETADEPAPTISRRRPAVNERTSGGPSAGGTMAETAGTPKPAETAAKPAPSSSSAPVVAQPAPAPKVGGWRRATPEEAKAQQQQEQP